MEIQYAICARDLTFTCAISYGASMLIMTATRSIPASNAGYTLSHERLLIDLSNLTRSYDGILDDECLAIRDFATSGGEGRTPAALRRISEATGVRIVMGAGWYRECVYSAFVNERDTNDLADLIVSTSYWRGRHRGPGRAASGRSDRAQTYAGPGTRISCGGEGTVADWRMRHEGHPG